ncbi:SDR family oxidoreductase [Candidatus Palauibacter sp.]|uniref:SDR family oxidoreductase n=1 Tax=Candidatus Palauibacter sp. TaxID=3101350 RepID=UPI003B5993EB
MNTTPRNPVPAVAMALAAFAAAWAASATGLPAQATPVPEPGQQVALVTGSTSGLGRELALRLGARGDHVIVHGRNEERGAEVVDAINAEGPGSARFYRADFASLSEVRQFAELLLADYDRLDILINNAGFGSAPDERLLTEDGHEYRFQVNYLSTFLLTHMLMRRLLASAPSRIVNVSSGAQTPIDFDDVMIEKNFSGRRAYAQSKLAQVMFTHDLAEELAGTGIVVGSLHPATYMPTEMVRRAGATPRATIAEGADATMRVVDSDDFESGQYFSGLRPTRANDQAYDPEARAELKRLSQELTGIRCRMGRCRFVGGSSE